MGRKLLSKRHLTISPSVRAISAGSATAFQELRIRRNGPTPEIASQVEQTTRQLVSCAEHEDCFRVSGRLPQPAFCASALFPWAVRGTIVRSADEKKKEPLERTGGSMNARKDQNIGNALRRVYSDAVDEDVPDDLLDLLSKLD